MTIDPRKSDKNFSIMFEGLYLTHLSAGMPHTPPCDKGYFHLSTCQRVIYLSYKLLPMENANSIEIYANSKAYHFLLQVICGLKSRILGENEISHQFKLSYLKYLEDAHRDPRIIKLLEKLLKDSKEIKSKYLAQIGQQSYAGITRRFLENKSTKKLLILGNGSMCQNLIKVLQKRFDISLSARNPEKSLNFYCPSIPWKDLISWAEFPLIVNTIGSEETFLDDSFFDLWAKKNPQLLTRQFIDLGYPSVLKTRYTVVQGVALLKDIFEKGDILDEEKRIKIERAQEAVKEITQKRANLIPREGVSFCLKNTGLEPGEACLP
jgi:glutamyl-tRNA reductase